MPSEISDLSGKVILVTGGTSGLGRETILELAKQHPAHVFFTGRDNVRATSLITDVKAVSSAEITFIQADFNSLKSIQSAAQTFLSKANRLDVLLCNAGVMVLPAGLTEDGYEAQFGINHVAHALLVKLLLPTLLRTAESPGAEPRVVFLTSQGYQLHPSGGIIFDQLRTTQDSGFSFPLGNAWMRYGQSKLANIIYPAELARRYPSITAVSVHPGATKTGMVTSQSLKDRVLLHLFSAFDGGFQTLAQGAKNSLWACTSTKSSITNGAYYEPIGVLRQSQLDGDASNPELAAKLWDWTVKELEAL